MRRSTRRLFQTTGGTMLAVAACAVVAGGVVVPDARYSLLAFCSIAAIVVASVARRFHFSAASVRAQRRSWLLAHGADFADADLGLALMAGLYASFALSGEQSSALYPLLYGTTAFMATFLSRPAAVATLLTALLLEGGSWLHAGSGSLAAVHGGALLGAFVCHWVFVRSLVSRHRREHEQKLSDVERTQRESARDYRLVAAALGPQSRAPRSRADEEARLAAGAVEAIRESFFSMLSVVKRAVDAETCVLLWMDDRTEALKIKELVSDSEEISEVAGLGQCGVLGAMIRDRALLCLPQTKAGQLPYYEGTHSTGAFLGVPVMDGPHMRGILCVDRDTGFGEREQAILSRAAEQVMRVVQSEQVFGAVERAKYEHERFFLASAMLGQALTLDEAMSTAFDAAAQIADYDVGVISMYEPQRRKHRIYSVRVKDPDLTNVRGPLAEGYEYRDNSGLASMVVKNRHYLPAGGELRDSSTPVFTKKVSFPDAASLVVLPLISGDEAIGTLTLVARRKQAFRKDIREMLGVIATQVAVSLSNALMYKKMETMATTDGLTGLTNHRTFQERFEDMVERSQRHGHVASVLLCDVDHFKSVNDTYGHPVGDEVLRQVARVLQAAVRKIDITARYGGEEFAVVLEATDAAGAVQLANRIREDVSKLVVDTDKGPFSVTMSLGVATFPDDAADRATLIERADHALYHAKENGRNRVVSYREYVAHSGARRAS